MQDFSILIVEDDDDARRNMEDILSLDAYRIRSVSHCLPAFDALESEHFDTAIVDWRLPDGDGCDLIPVITRELPNTPVVVVTGMRDFDAAVKALRNGAYDLLLKPINPDALRSVLRRLVERKRHLLEIESAQAKLVASERLAAIGQMVAGLAHESRNAFQRSHACLAELTLDLQDMPDSLRLVHKVQTALDDINSLLEQLREYSAPINLDRRDCQIESLIQHTWQQILEAEQPHPAPELIVNRTDPVPESLNLDQNRTMQVLRNLLENATFACQTPGRITVDLSTTRHRHRDGIRIAISDNGHGVPPENREEIFAPFFTTKTRGTGLGLAISRRIIEAHGGRIHVTNAESGGAKFIVDLPIRVGKKAADSVLA